LAYGCTTTHIEFGLLQKLQPSSVRDWNSINHLELPYVLFRNGLFHQAMPKLGKTGYCFNHTFTGYPEFKVLDGHPVICIDPWKFTDRVIKEFLSDPKLIMESVSYPLPSILPIPFDKLTELE